MSILPLASIFSTQSCSVSTVTEMHSSSFWMRTKSSISSLLMVLIPHGAALTALLVEILCVGLVFVTLLATTRQGRAELRKGLKVARLASERVKRLFTNQGVGPR